MQGMHTPRERLIKTDVHLISKCSELDQAVTLSSRIASLNSQSPLMYARVTTVSASFLSAAFAAATTACSTAANARLLPLCTLMGGLRSGPRGTCARKQKPSSSKDGDTSAQGNAR